MIHSAGRRQISTALNPPRGCSEFYGTDEQTQQASALLILTPSLCVVLLLASVYLQNCFGEAKMETCQGRTPFFFDLKMCCHI